jgi:hypothetical protein
MGHLSIADVPPIIISLPRPIQNQNWSSILGKI